MVGASVGAVALGVASIVVAQVEQSSSDNVWLYIVDRYGLPIAFLALALLVFRNLYDRRVREIDAVTADKAELEASVRADVIPVLVRATEAIERFSILAERNERRLDERDSRR